MLTQKDFIGMLGDLEAHIDKTITLLDGILNEVEDRDLRFRFLSILQAKQRHLDAMNALASLVRNESGAESDDQPAA